MQSVKKLTLLILFVVSPLAAANWKAKKVCLSWDEQQELTNHLQLPLVAHTTAPSVLHNPIEAPSGHLESQTQEFIASFLHKIELKASVFGVALSSFCPDTYRDQETNQVYSCLLVATGRAVQDMSHGYYKINGVLDDTLKREGCAERPDRILKDSTQLLLVNGR